MSHLNLPMRDHVKRLWWAILGKWDPDYDPNDKPPKKRRGYFGEIGHSGKNILVEGLRSLHWWNRGKKKKRDRPYRFPK